MDSLHPCRPQRGLTLIESAVTLAVAAVLACAAAPGFGALLERYRLTGLATQLASDIQWLRAEAALRNDTLRLSLYASNDGSCYLLHSGSRSQCRCDAGSAAASCDGEAQAFKAVALPASGRLAVQANVSSIAFDPLHGTATPAGTLRVFASSGRAVHHVVNVLGRLRSCTPAAPGAPLPGYPSC
jgi:type IV fimbrial biogenesis protein FimT